MTASAHQPPDAAGMLAAIAAELPALRAAERQLTAHAAALPGVPDYAIAGGPALADELAHGLALARWAIRAVELVVVTGSPAVARAFAPGLLAAMEAVGEGRAVRH